MNLSVKKSEGGKHVVKVEDWLGGISKNVAYMGKSSRRSKDMRNIVYMSSVFGRNKVQGGKMAETGQPFKSGRQ